MSNGTGRVPIMACVRDAWRFLFDNWRMFVPAAAVVALVSFVAQAIALMLPTGDTVSPATMFIVVLLGMIAGVMFTAAVLRKAVRDEYKPPVGLTFGPDEGRIIAVNASIILVAMPVALLVSVVFMATIFRQVADSPEAMEALAADPQAMAEAVLQAVGPFGALALLVIAMVIISLATGLTALANAATIGEQKIIVFQSWRWLSGNFLRVLAVFILVVTPVAVVNSIISEVLLTALASMSGEAVAVVPFLLVSATITFLSVIVAIPATTVGAVLYKGLRPAGFVPK